MCNVYLPNYLVRDVLRGRWVNISAQRSKLPLSSYTFEYESCGRYLDSDKLLTGPATWDKHCGGANHEQMKPVSTHPISRSDQSF